MDHFFHSFEGGGWSRKIKVSLEKPSLISKGFNRDLNTREFLTVKKFFYVMINVVS